MSIHRLRALFVLFLSMLLLFMYTTSAHAEPPPPQIEITPNPVEEVHINPPMVSTQTLTVRNNGTDPLTWNLLDESQAPVVLDGSFEGGTPNSVWEEYFLYFSPFCTETVCPASGFTTPTPHSGTWFVRFGGGYFKPASQTITQTLTIPTDATELRFWLKVIERGNPPAQGDVSVSIDGNVLFAVANADPGYQDYTLVQRDITAYADGLTHTLVFNGGGITDEPDGPSFVALIDDVQIVRNAACATALDIPWLALDPANGTVTPATEQLVKLTFDSNGIDGNIHSETVCVESNDPTIPIAQVPVTLILGPVTTVTLSTLTATPALAAIPLVGIAAMLGLLFMKWWRP